LPDDVLLEVHGEGLDQLLRALDDRGHRRLRDAERHDRRRLVGDERGGHPDQDAYGLGLLRHDVDGRRVQGHRQHLAAVHDLGHMPVRQRLPAVGHFLGGSGLVRGRDSRNPAGGLCVSCLHRRAELPRQRRELRYLVLVDVRPRHADDVQEIDYWQRQVINRHAISPRASRHK